MNYVGGLGASRLQATLKIRAFKLLRKNRGGFAPVIHFARRSTEARVRTVLWVAVFSGQEERIARNPLKGFG